MPITHISGASASRAINQDVAGSSLAENLRRAANSDAPSRAAASSVVLISSKDAYSNLQKQASDACFSKDGLSEFVFNSAQKTSMRDKDASALALLDCAINVHLIKESGLVGPQALKPVEEALQHLAERFQQRPSRSMVGLDLSHRTRYYDYAALTQKIDKLLSEAPGGSDKVFDNIQLQLTSAYVVDGLRGRVESDWGPLTAQDARAVMENGNFTAVAGKVLNGQLKVAKAGGTGRTLGEFIRQTLKTMDLHRTGRAADPEASRPDDQPRSMLPEQLIRCCGGHGSVPNITVSPTMSTGGVNVGLTEAQVRDIIRDMQRQDNGGAVNNSQDADVKVAGNDRSINTPRATIIHGIPPALISSAVKETVSQSTQTDVVERSDSSSNTEGRDGLNEEGGVADSDCVPQPVALASVSNTSASSTSSIPPPPPRPEDNPLLAASRFVREVAVGSGSSVIDDAIASSPIDVEPFVSAAETQSEDSDVARLLSTLRNGSADISIRTNNLPAAYVIDFGLPLSKRNENFNRSVSEAIQFGVKPMTEFVALKQLISHGETLVNLQKNPVYQAAAEFNSSFASRMTLLLNARDNAAIPAAFKPGQLPYVNGAASGQPAIVETPGTPTAEEFLTMLNAGNAGVRVVLNNLPGQAPINFNGDVDAQGNNTAVNNFNKQIKSVLQLHATVHPAFEQIRADLGEGKSQVEMRENPAYVALCMHSPALENRLNRLVYASKRGNDSADRNGADSPEVNLTAGRNHYLSFNPSSLALVNR